MSKQDEVILNQFISVAEMLGQMFAPLLEVVVHDLRSPKKSIICIVNNQITGRKVGDPTTDLGEARISNSDIPDLIVGYENKSPTGHKLKSSSMAIKNSYGNLIGSLCLNLEVTAFEQYGEFISTFISTTTNEYIGSKERFGVAKAEGSVEEVFDKYVAANGLSSKQLSPKQRRTLVRYLHAEGVFEKKNAVNTLAKKLNVTRASIYNYLKESH